MCFITTFFSFYSVKHFDEEYPDMCLLEKPVQFTVNPGQKPVTISPPGHGVSLKIPQDAVQLDKPVNVAFKTCMSGRFKYPEGYDPLSPVYHITTDTPFKSNVELSIEHFANIETEEQAKQMTFFVARPLEKDEEIQFSPIEGGKFVAGKESCTLSTQSFSFFSAGIKQIFQMRKMLFPGSVCFISGTMHACIIFV